jgi:hypothetical protein
LCLIAIAAFVGYLARSDPRAFFGEQQPVTFFSAAQLLATAWIAWKVAGIRWAAGASIAWLLFAAGFLFLAFDELFLIHEQVDFTAHRIFGLTETGLSDRLDDFLIGIYGLVRVAVIAFYWDELKQCIASRRFVLAGFLLLYLIVMLDTLTNRNDVLVSALGPEVTRRLAPWLDVAEESAKVLAEALFLIAGYAALIVMRCATFGKELPVRHSRDDRL